MPGSESYPSMEWRLNLNGIQSVTMAGPNARITRQDGSIQDWKRNEEGAWVQSDPSEIDALERALSAGYSSRERIAKALDAFYDKYINEIVVGEVCQGT